MAKTNPLGVRIQTETKEALERAAKDDLRSLSSLVEKILIEWCRERGYLPTEEEAAPAPKKTGKGKTSE